MNLLTHSMDIIYSKLRKSVGLSTQKYLISVCLNILHIILLSFIHLDCMVIYSPS